MAKKKSTSDNEHPASFEAALAELESVVADLEKGELGLAESLQRYELGIRRIRQCQEQLQQAERRIVLLSGVDADGKPITRPFDDSEIDSLEEKAAARGRRRSANHSVNSGEVDDGRSLF